MGEARSSQRVSLSSERVLERAGEEGKVVRWAREMVRYVAGRMGGPVLERGRMRGSERGGRKERFESLASWRRRGRRAGEGREGRVRIWGRIGRPVEVVVG